MPGGPIPSSQDNVPLEPKKDHFNLGRATVPPALHDPEQRKRWGLPESETEPGPYMIELNLQYSAGVQKAAEAFEELYARLIPSPMNRPAVAISKTYFRCDLTVQEWKALIREDESHTDNRDRIIYKIWPDFPVSRWRS